MAHFIDKDAVLAEIEELIADENESIKCFEHRKNVSEVKRSNARICILMYIRSFLDTLEVKELDIEKEIGNIWNPRFNLGWDEKSLLSVNHEGFTNIAKHFFELGMAVSNKALKGEEV